MDIKTKRLWVKVNCFAQYTSWIDVPEDLDLEEAVEYAEENIEKLPFGATLEWVRDDGIDEDCCEFE